MNQNHIIKYTHREGEKLHHSELWCGAEAGHLHWYFQDAQHAALSADGGIGICPDCAQAIINELMKVVVDEPD